MTITKNHLPVVFCFPKLDLSVQQQNRLSAVFVLLLRFFMLRALHAPIAKLLELDFALNFLLVFLAPVVGSLASRAGEFY